MKILVTGSSGFVAKHLIPKLEKLGHFVYDMDLEYGYDCKSYDDCLACIKDSEVVIHLAAFTDVQESITYPVEYFVNNLGGLVTMLGVADTKHVKRFIFASSAAADSPQSPYGVTKLCGESWCDIFKKCYGLSTISLRFFNVYGNGTDKGVIPLWIKAIKNGERPVIYGGNQVRDFVYVKDVVDAIVLAMKSNRVGTYEIGTGKGIAIFDLSFVLLEAMKSDLKIIPKEAKDGEIQKSIASIGSSGYVWGWKPKYTLEAGLKEMLK